MNITKVALFIMLISTLSAACSSSDAVGPEDQITAQDPIAAQDPIEITPARQTLFEGIHLTRWTLVRFEVQGAFIPKLADTEITLAFDDDLVVGSAGCNTYRGGYQSTPGGEFSAAPVSDPLAGRCESDELMDQQNRFLRVLAATQTWEIETGDSGRRYELVLRTLDGDALFFRVAT